MTLLDRW